MRAVFRRLGAGKLHPREKEPLKGESEERAAISLYKDEIGPRTTFIGNLACTRHGEHMPLPRDTQHDGALARIAMGAHALKYINTYSDGGSCPVLVIELRVAEFAVVSGLSSLSLRLL
ncbi:hypothetical protein MTR_6g083260 [Medicago truncatula]|uniref:Uncharacterized protein n=1 Tax=Medicago truncatula TaxID=3880 RepID=A0A072UMD7_MEDTR|nr:hypothetical protein MTR_6g083260 [Medicago truncatula]